MIPIQAAIFLYAGMLIESPKRREQFITLLNGAGTEVEKMINNFASKKGAANNAPIETTTAEESTEFR